MCALQEQFDFSSKQKVIDFLKSDALPHAIILQGANKTESLSAAKFIAAYAVCAGENKPCFKCGNCVKAFSKNHPDIMWVKGTGTNGRINVSDIRRICGDSYIKPNEADCKVYILEDCELLNTQAQNAFLKSLEEPAGNILYILQCTSAYGLLETITSRCISISISSTPDEGSEEKQKAVERASEIASALCKNTGYDLMWATYFSGGDRDYYLLVLSELKQILVCALLNKAYLPYSAESQNLRKALSKKKLTAMISTIDEATDGMKRNTNINLFSTWLCSALEKIKADNN
ncbi:MAG: hypothetical protein K6F76_04105 [Clostridiales bacterium]|nr:hypothetical protein [Clostridiales bacterium]